MGGIKDYKEPQNRDKWHRMWGVMRPKDDYRDEQFGDVSSDGSDPENDYVVSWFRPNLIEDAANSYLYVSGWMTEEGLIPSKFSLKGRPVSASEGGGMRDLTHFGHHLDMYIPPECYGAHRVGKHPNIQPTTDSHSPTSGETGIDFTFRQNSGSALFLKSKLYIKYICIVCLLQHMICLYIIPDSRYAYLAWILTIIVNIERG